MKRLLLLVLAIALMLLGACGAPVTSPVETPPPPKPSPPPVPEPAPTPMPEPPKESVDILQSVDFVVDFVKYSGKKIAYTLVLGEVQNNTGHNIKLVEIALYLYDDREVAYYKAYSKLRILRPGDISPFGGYIPDSTLFFTDYKLRIEDYEETDEEPSAGTTVYTVYDVQGRIRAYSKDIPCHLDEKDRIVPILEVIEDEHSLDPPERLISSADFWVAPYDERATFPSYDYWTPVVIEKIKCLRQ